MAGGTRRGKVAEHEVYMPGALLTVYRTRQDGFTRVEIRDYHTEVMTTLYMTAEERAKWADAFAGSNPRVLPKVTYVRGKR